MTMKERLETAINGIRANSKIPALDEAGVRTQVIDRLLERLGWEIFDENEFRREYPVPGGRVDYALLDNGDPKVFIEAKGPTEQLGHHEDQLVTYSAKRGVPLATLTNGLEWWLYLPLQVGSFEARRFCRLDISKMEVTKACDVLIAYLAQENVYSGAAVNKAEAHLKQLQDARRIDEALPRAWKELIDGPDGLLVDLINDKVKGLCGVEAAPERIKGFLEGLGKPVVQPTKPSPPITDDTKGGRLGAGGGTGIRGSLIQPIQDWGCPRAIALAKAGFGPGEVFRNNTERDHTKRRLVGPDYRCPVRGMILGKQLAGDGTLGGRFNGYMRNHIGDHPRSAECEDVGNLVHRFGTG